MNLDDAVQRWSGTFLKVKGVPYYVEALDSTGHEDVFNLRVHKNEGGSWSSSRVQASVADISEEAPELGNRQVGKVAFHIQRRATHQFKRGLVPGQLDARVIGSVQHFPMSNDWTLQIPSPKALDVLYDTTYPPMLQGLRDVAQGKLLSCAFSKDLAVVASYSRWPALYYRRNPVGLIKGDIVELAPAADFLRELVQQSSPLRVTVK